MSSFDMADNMARSARENTDESALEFDRAVAPLVPLLLRYFVRRVPVRDDAADCTSEALLTLWRHRARLPQSADEQRAWAYGIARKVLANHARGRRRRAESDQALRDAISVPVPAAPDEALVAAEALLRLRPREQELVRLVVWEQLSVADAARVLGISAGAARVRYSRALARLRNEFASLNV